jgi:hypothetical protein
MRPPQPPLQPGAPPMEEELDDILVSEDDLVEDD